MNRINPALIFVIVAALLLISALAVFLVVENNRTTEANSTATATAYLNSGLGVSRQSVQSTFSKGGYTFNEALPMGTKPRSVGKSSDGLISIELIGADQNIEEAVYQAKIIAGSQTNEYRAALLTFFSSAAPRWQNPNAFVNTGLDRMVAGARTYSDYQGNYTATMNFEPNSSMVAIRVRFEQNVKITGVFSPVTTQLGR